MRGKRRHRDLIQLFTRGDQGIGGSFVIEAQGGITRGDQRSINDAHQRINTPVADLKIFVEPKEGSTIAVNNGLHGYVSGSEAQAYKKELETLRAQTADEVHAAQTQASDEVNRFRSIYATKLQFDYQLDAKTAREPFLVSAIYHDDSFTYIKCGAREKPALYEIKDGKPNLISFQFENGVYIAPKIIDSGYLAIGKKKLPFARHTAGN